MSDVRVRRAERGDAPALLAMLVALSRMHGREPTIGLEAFERDGWDEPARFQAWIAEAAAGAPLGFVQGFPKYASWTGGDWFFVANLWVEPDWPNRRRRHGADGGGRGPRPGHRPHPDRAHGRPRQPRRSGSTGGSA